MKNKNGNSCLGATLAAFGILISAFWLLNFQMGVFELPDNLPIIGNLDEVFFTMVFLGCLSYFGIEIPFLSRRYGAQKPRAQTDKLPPPDGGGKK